jgi:hypothetical protein
MRAPSFATRRVRALDVALALALAVGCGNGGMQAHVEPDAGPGDAGPDADAGSDAADGEREAPGSDTSDATDASDAETVSDDATDDGDAGPAGDRPVQSDATDAADAPSDAPRDISAERPSATASWTIAPNPMCTAAGAGCMDTGTVGGYQITASGSCPTASDIQLWFPGGATPLGAATYAVKAATGILDVIAMPAGMVGVLAERDDASKNHFRLWGRAGTVTVTAVGAARHVTFAGVSLRDETTSAMTTLGADVTCP